MGGCKPHFPNCFLSSSVYVSEHINTKCMFVLGGLLSRVNVRLDL